MENYRKLAKLLGQRGGKVRAKKLSAQQRKDIASLGGQKRVQSLQIKKAMIENFRYLEAIRLLSKPVKVRQVSSCKQRLPGIYLK
ncbi:MAG: hypothetical protein H7A32_03485 [Deltaproteobacteria bacterium]|nr:hypothetical protein [Deltaproteobacteria bacterium]